MTDIICVREGKSVVKTGFPNRKAAKDWIKTLDEADRKGKSVGRGKDHWRGPSR